MIFHVLIATIGRHSIFNLLDSLLPQLTEDDYLTIVYDAQDIVNTQDDVDKN